MSNYLSGAPTDLHVTIRTVYGNDRVYPICERAKLLAELSGKTTFTEPAIATLKKLGFTFVLTSARRVL